jgi:peptidoglycan hydrolase-like protein with peptidoglycan-binding domain
VRCAERRFAVLPDSVIARTLFSALAVSLALAPAAAAQDPVPTPPAPTPTPTPVPAPAPAAGTAGVRVENAIRDGKSRILLGGDRWRVRGTVKPFVAGQTMRLRFTRGGKAVKTKRVKLKPGPNGTGTFLVAFKARTPGRYAVVAAHKATPQLEALRSRAARLRVLAPSIGLGQSGAIVRLLQRGLKRLHYYVPTSGHYDSATQRAVMAWRKIRGVARNYSASSVVIRGVLAGRGRFKVRHPKEGHHVEADLSRQVLALIDGGKVRAIYHTSSGAPGTPTVLGRYKVYRKDLGTNGLGMVDASYFIGGYAIHGYVSVPAFNASHGCLRVPIPDARRISNWLNYGDVVWVYP